ncbi:MAG: hypothetical protein Kow00121_35430 [Elainellaceae cyanobacterium]
MAPGTSVATVKGAVSRFSSISSKVKAIMSDEFRDLPLSGREFVVVDRTFNREAVRILLLGKPELVQQVIQELHLRRFCEVGVWSRPLRLAEHQQQLSLNPGEVMRIYKRYLSH